MSTRRQLVTIDEAKPAKGQHKKPCGDCPWSRHSLPGWLGGETVDAWLAEAHSDNEIPCHTLQGVQCAGSSIYRRNVCKTPRPGSGVLRLEADRELVFATPSEFKEHHTTRPHGAVPSPRTGRGTPQASKRVSVMATKTFTKDEVDAKVAKLAAAHSNKLASHEAKTLKAGTKVVGDIRKLADLHDKIAAVNQQVSATPSQDAAKKKKIEGLIAQVRKITDKYPATAPTA
jgi:hypothetical protein